MIVSDYDYLSKNKMEIEEECREKSAEEIFAEVKKHNIEKNKIEKVIDRDFVITLGAIGITTACAISAFLTSDFFGLGVNEQELTTGLVGCWAVNALVIAKTLYNTHKYHSIMGKELENKRKLEVAFEKLELERQ